MNKVNSIYLRRQVLDWRDKYVEETRNHLSREIILLFNLLDQEIEKMTAKDVFLRNKTFRRKNIQPIYTQWVEIEVNKIITSAQSDIIKIYRQALEHQKNDTDLKDLAGSEQFKDAAIAGLATGGAIAAIPALASWSVVSAGGIAGMIGVTVISWPVALAGITLISGLLAFGGSRAVSVKSHHIQRVKETTKKNIREQVLGNEGKSCVCENVQEHFEKVATNILNGLKA